MLCMPGTILRSFEEDERAMVPGLWFMTDAAGATLSRVASPGFVSSPPSPVHPWSSPRWRSAIWHRGLHHPGSVPTQQEPGLSIALKTDAIGLIDCMLSAITSQGWTLLVSEPLERPPQG